MISQNSKPKPNNRISHTPSSSTQTTSSVSSAATGEPVAKKSALNRQQIAQTGMFSRTFDTLPNEMILAICNFLSLSALINLHSTCKGFNCFTSEILEQLKGDRMIRRFSSSKLRLVVLELIFASLNNGTFMENFVEEKPKKKASKLKPSNPFNEIRKNTIKDILDKKLVFSSEDGKKYNLQEAKIKKIKADATAFRNRAERPFRLTLYMICFVIVCMTCKYYFGDAFR